MQTHRKCLISLREISMAEGTQPGHPQGTPLIREPRHAAVAGGDTGVGISSPPASAPMRSPSSPRGGYPVSLARAEPWRGQSRRVGREADHRRCFINAGFRNVPNPAAFTHARVFPTCLRADELCGAVPAQGGP